MQNFLGTLVGKLIKAALVLRKGGGQALPGLVVEKLFPGYVTSMLRKLPEGIVVVTGTNGKTTTTKIVVHLLEASGKRVLTNSTGSNLTRGLVSSISQHASLSGRLTYDIAVLEVDEATARRFVKRITPKWVLALNVSRDQLDRYGEVDTIALYVGAAMSAAEGIVANANDPHIYKLAEEISANDKKPTVYFGSAQKLKKFFPSDYELAAVRNDTAEQNVLKLDVELADFRGQDAAYLVDGKNYQTHLKLTGQHNFLNAAAALSLCRRLLPDTTTEDLVRELANVDLAFGRGETYRLENGAEIELVLVKNPASFTQALSSYGAGQENLMIAINDNIADGRDVSWLWDVNLSPLSGKQITVASGTRAADMALRLSYEDIKVHAIESDLKKAIDILGDASGKKVILATYTAMLWLHSWLSKRGKKKI